ncbi:MAG: superoxide dismutase family protein [Nitrospirota bacterium]
MRYVLVMVMMLVLGAVVYAQEAGPAANAIFYNDRGDEIGRATLTETAHGVLITAELRNLPPGPHGFHIHAVGKCEPPFKTAGGHFNPTGKKHGYMNPDGMHAGDLPNLYAGSDGKARAEVLAGEVTLREGKASLFDADGSALVVHAKSDDYKSDPAGDSGDRIACGVITK